MKAVKKGEYYINRFDKKNIVIKTKSKMKNKEVKKCWVYIDVSKAFMKSLLLKDYYEFIELSLTQKANNFAKKENFTILKGGDFSHKELTNNKGLAGLNPSLYEYDITTVKMYRVYYYFKVV